MAQSSLTDNSSPDPQQEMLSRYRRRSAGLRRWLRPPIPLIYNRREQFLPHAPGPKLYVGGAGRRAPEGFINLDISYMPGVDVVCDLQQLPFAADSIAAIECDAVLEHVQDPDLSMEQMWTVLAPGGVLHVVVPFCHPFHSYPSDYRRWSEEGLKILGRDFELLAIGFRTGPTATMLAFFLEYLKICSPRVLKRPVYAVFGWILSPLRYLDLLLNRRPDAGMLANHVYGLFRKPVA